MSRCLIVFPEGIHYVRREISAQNQIEYPANQYGT